jgi:hypothetical protein
MNDSIDERGLCAMTRSNRSIAIAESVEGLGCSVYADGGMMASWASYQIEEFVGVHIHNGALVTTQSSTRYFLLRRDLDTERFEFLSGPLTADELTSAYTARAGVQDLY